ncbi:YadA-like family protein [Acinetobacter baumannii]|uniref:YadA-like family protein n=1 Tax=Acinetobacter baumannii TaxID=470 RepID=UPI003B9855A0
MAIGANLAAQGAQSTVIGNDIISSTSAEQSVIIGSNYNSNPVTSNGKGGVAIGSGLSTTHSSPIADGQGSLALGSSGDGTTINGTTYNQQGPDAKAAYSAALMAGSQVATGADKSIAFGVDAKVSANIKDAIALGTGAVASVNNSVALGGGSTTTAPTGTGYITNTTAPTSVVSVGSSTNLRRIQNVADGAADQDAVTVAQLKDVNNRAVGNTTALGGGAAYDPSTNVYTAPTFTTTKTDGTTVNSNTVSGALTNLNNEVIKPITFSGNTGSSANKLGSTLNITGTGSTAGTYSGNNLKTSVSGNTVSIQMADAPVFTGTVTAGNLATGGTLSVTGVSNLNGGANLNNQKITNVAAGTASGDAVNFGQLTTTNNNVTTAQTTANSALAEAQKGINFGDGSTSNNYALGETINVKGDSNINSVTTADGVQLSLASDISVDSVTAGNSKLNNSGLTITGGPSITTAGIDAANTNISNVADATTADQAVNKGQLDAATAAADNKTDALGNSTANNLGGGATYDSTTGAVTAPTYTVNGTDVNNVGAAISELDKGWNLASNGANAGAIKAGDTVDIGTAAGETNLQVAKSGNTIQYSLSRDLDLDSVTAGNSKLNNSGLTITGGPSITTAGIDAAGNTISNVAAGTNATDAVNKGQLDHVDNRVTQVTNTTASIFGGGAKANTDGSISNPTYNVAGTSANNVGDALTALDKAVTDAGTAANAGWTVSANGDAATAKNIKPNGKVNFTGDDNLTVAQSSETDNEGNIKVALNKNLKVDSVTTGNTVIDTTGVKVGNNVHLGSTGLIIAGGPSITTSGISAGNKTISNVAAGVSSTDAVNKGQLDSAISSINNNVGALANSAVQYDKNSDGSVNKDSITLAGGANGTTIKNVANGTVAEGSKDAVNGGQLWTVQQQVNKNTGDISNLQTDISNINNGKSGLVQQADKDAAITVGKDTGGTQVNVAGTAGERTVTGVKAGAVTESSKDAVNGSQLNTTNQALVNYLGGGAGYDNITQSFSNPTYNVGDQSYHNVGDAIGALNQADQTLNTKIDNVSNKLEQAFYATNQRIDDVEKRANAGIAAAMALENAPFVAGKYTYAVGAAYHGGENAVGVTLRKTADNGRWSLTGGVAAASQGDPSVRIGISGVID